jgi:nitroreductase
MELKETKFQKELLRKRYGFQSTTKNIHWNQYIELLLNHRSVRHYLKESLETGVIETMVAAAQSASRSSNLNQWSVVVITDPDLKEKISRVSQREAGGVGNPYIEQAPVLLLWIADLSRSNTIAKQAGGNAEIHDYLDAFVMATVDAALAAQNAAIAAESMGLGVVYIGAMRNQSREIAELIGLPDYSYVTFGMVVGKPDPDHLNSIRPRPSQEVVLHYNNYNMVNSLDALDTYEESFQKFRKEQKMKEKQWKKDVAYTANSLDYMHGRQNLRTTVEERGFKLK